MALSDPERLGSKDDVPGVAGRLGHGLAELATDIGELLSATVPSLREDDRERKLLQESVQRDIDVMLAQEARGEPVGAVQAPNAALDHARGLVQRGVSMLAVIRAYRAAERRFLRRLLTEVLQRANFGSEESRSTLERVDRVSDYVDHVVQQLVESYSRSRHEWLNPDAILAARVRSLLSDLELDVDTAQGRLHTYRLRQQHVGVELWLKQPEPLDAHALMRRTADSLAQAAESIEAPLYVAYDASNACVWIPLGDRTAVDRERLAAAAGSFANVYGSLGEVHPSLPGFRRTHQQAVIAETVARVPPAPLAQLTAYGDVAPIASLANDLDAARAWVSETLGDLAIDDARHATLRETARVFFETGGSYAATAERLSVHRNTAQYRLRTAEDIRGRPFRDDRLDVELALLACHWFGPAVLRPPNTKQA